MSRDVTAGFLSIFSAKVATVLVTVTLTPLLVRFLGSTGYGEYAFVLAVFSVLLMLINAGIYDGVRKFIAEDRDTPNWSGLVFGYYLRLSTVLALVAAAGVAAFSWSGVVADVLGQPFDRYFLLVALMLVGRQLFQTIRGALMGLGQERYSESFVVGRKVTFAVLAVALAATGWGVSGVLLGNVISAALFSVLALAVLARTVDLGPILGRLPRTFPRREFGLFNLGSVVLVVLTASLYHVDILLLQPFRGSQETGYYRAALLVSEFLWFASLALQTTLLHSSSELWAEDRRDEISRLAARATRYTLTATVLLAIGVGALADPFVTVYFGAEFAAASTPIVFLLPGVIGFAVARPIVSIGQGKGELRVLVAATGTAAVLNLGLNLLLIPRYGMVGAAVATSVGYGSMAVLHVGAARLIGFDPLGDLRPVRLLAVAAVSAPVVVGASWLIASPILSLAVVPVIGGIVYGAATLRFGLVSVAELQPLIDRLPGRVATGARRVVGWIA